MRMAEIRQHLEARRGTVLAAVVRGRAAVRTPQRKWASNPLTLFAATT